MLRSSLRRSTRLVHDATVKSVKPRVTRRFASGHGEQTRSSDLPWAIPSIVITVPICFYLWSNTPKMEADHRWERRTQRLAQQEKEEAEEESQEEEKPEEEEESTPTEQATGEDNVNASAEKASAENKEGDIVDPSGKGDTLSKQGGVSNAPTKAAGRTASAGPESAGTDEPVKKDETTQDPEGESDTKKKLEKVSEDK